MDVDKIAEAIAGDTTCAQGEFWQRKIAVVAHLMETGHELAASQCENERLRAALKEAQPWVPTIALHNMIDAALDPQYRKTYDADQQATPPDDHPLLQMGEDLRPTTFKSKVGK